MAFPDSALSNQWTDGEALTAAMLNARIDARLNALLPYIRMDTGTVNITPVANTTTTLAVSFNFTFPSAPAVYLQIRTAIGSGATVFPTVSGETTSGFTLSIMASTTTARNIRWLALL